MNVLIVAYACEPGKGSESGIGWDWATGLARLPGLNVTVLTRSNNRATVEAALDKIDGPVPAFEYWDLPHRLSWWKKGRAAIYPYYWLWVRGVGRRLDRLVAEAGIDIVHHLTFSTDWLPGSVPPDLRCASIVGPLGGYDTSAQMAGFVKAKYLRRDRWKKRIRTLGLRLRRREIRRYDALIANNPGFGDHYRGIYGDLPLNFVSTQLSVPPADPALRDTQDEGERLVVMAGRILYWKGFDAALQALAACRDRNVRFRAIVVGDGEEKYRQELAASAAALSLEIEFRRRMERPDFLNLLAHADVFLYPTFYGTADSIMMEAVERGLPVVCFPSHGARELLGDEYPHMATGFDIEDLADRLQSADKDLPESRAASEAVLHRHSWQSKLTTVTNIYATALAAFEKRRESIG